MQNQIQVFQNEEFGKVRVIEIDGFPWFVGKDVADVLGYNQTSNMLKRLDEEDFISSKLDGMNMRSTLINESGLYAAIIGSRLPKARAFKRWVTSDVLPSIRKHGAYVIDAILEEAAKNQDFAWELFRKLQMEKGKTTALLNKVEELAPKARYYDLILQSKGLVQVSIIAKDYGMTAVVFNRLLHDLGIQFKMGDTWLLYQRHANQGYTKTRTYYTPGGSGVIHTYWTQKGRIFLYETLFKTGVIPLMDSENPAI